MGGREEKRGILAAYKGGKDVKEKWEFFHCECGREFAVKQLLEDELEEPACPECGETNSLSIGGVNVVEKQG